MDRKSSLVLAFLALFVLFAGAAFSYSSGYEMGCPDCAQDSLGDLRLSRAEFSAPPPGWMFWVEKGVNSPPNHQWLPDPNASIHEQYNVMLQLDLTVLVDEIIYLKEIEMESFGTGDDRSDILEVVGIVDANNNGVFDSSETISATTRYPGDDLTGRLAFYDEVVAINPSETLHLLIAYRMNSSAVADSTYGFIIKRQWVYGLGADTRAHYLEPNNVSIFSAIKKIGPANVQPPLPPPSTQTVLAPGAAIPAHSYAPDSGDEFNEMLSFSITANAGYAKLSALKLKAGGSGDDAAGIKNVNLVYDADADGVHDAGETVLAKGGYGQDDGSLELWLTDIFAIRGNSTAYFLISYEMAQAIAADETFSLEITGIEVRDPGGSVDFSASLPLVSSVKKIAGVAAQPPVSCMGNASLSFDSEKTEPGAPVVGIVEGLENCDGKDVKLARYSCAGEVAGSCMVANGNCKISFAAPASPGNYLYYACVDMNGDGDVGDSGEQAYASLKVAEPGTENTQPQPAECSQQDCGKCQLKEKCIVVGCNWCSETCQPTPCPSEKCKGSIEAVIIEPTAVSSTLNALVKVKGTNNCGGKSVLIKADSCAGKTIASCTLSGDECMAVLPLLSTEGKYSYAVCIDKDGDLDYGSPGESALVVQKGAGEEGGKEAGGIEEKKKEGGITGGAKPLIDAPTLLAIIVVASIIAILLLFLGKKKKAEVPPKKKKERKVGVALFSVLAAVLTLGFIFISGCTGTGGGGGQSQGNQNNQGVVAEKILFRAPSALPDGRVGVPYFYSFCKPDLKLTSDLCGGFNKTTDPTGGSPPYSFYLGSGTGFPPFGLSLNLNGILSGTPKKEGTRKFQVCAKDVGGDFACKDVSLTIKNGFAGTWVGIVTLVEYGPAGSFYEGCYLEEEYRFDLVQNGSEITGTVAMAVGDVVSCAPEMSVLIGKSGTVPVKGTVSGDVAKFSYESAATFAATDYAATLLEEGLATEIATCVSPDPRCTCNAPDPRCPGGVDKNGMPLPGRLETINWFAGEFMVTRPE